METAKNEAAAESKGGRRPFVVLFVVLVVAVGGIGGWSMAHANEEATDNAMVESDVVPIAARVGGQLLAVKVKENQLVKAGDVLFELDPADFQARAKQAEAELETARAQAAAADAQAQVVEVSARGGLSSAQAVFQGSGAAVSSATAQIAAAQASLTRAESDVRKTKLDLERAQTLRAANAVPQERLDNAQAANDSAEAALQASRAQLSAAQEQRRAAESRVGEARGRVEQSSPIDAQIAAARAQAKLAHARVQSSEAALELAKNQLSYAQVKAPTDGVVSKLGVHPGQLVSPGQPLVELVPQGTYLVANFKETQVGRIKAGQKVEVKLDAFPGRVLEGQVESLSSGTGSRFALLPPDNASGNYVKVVQRVPVRIAWAQAPSGLDLRAGLSAEVTVKVQ